MIHKSVWEAAGPSHEGDASGSGLLLLVISIYAGNKTDPFF